MRLFETGYMKKVISSQEEMQAFAQRMVTHCRDHGDSEQMGDLTQKIVDEHYQQSRSEDSSLRSGIYNLMSSISLAFSQDGDWMLPPTIIDHRMHYFDGNLRRLREYMRRVDRADDSVDAEEYLTNNLEIYQCSDCSGWEYSDHSHSTYQEESVCRECVSNNYTYSSYYGSYVYYEYASDAIGPNGEHITIHNEDDNFLWDDDEDSYVHREYQPQPRVFGDYHSSKRSQKPINDDWSLAKHRWLGVELEVELRDEMPDRVQKAKVLNEIINAGEVGSKVFFERDGSLNNGIEIISQPMSLPMHHELWQWLNNRTATTGLRSHNTSTCGLHVHVNRDALSQIQIARIVTFINDPNNEHLIRAIARRYAEGYCRIKEKKLDDAAFSTDRYEAVNITGSNTIEFRIFKGSIKYESVVAAIEFANAMVDFSTKFVKAEELSTNNFLSFINDDVYKETTYLRPYISNRLELA